MSLDLDWSLLDASLADSLLDKLNGSLAKATRPDFIGPITLTSLEFGEDCPDVRITGVGDVWKEFIEATREPTGGTSTSVNTTPNRANAGPSDSSEGVDDDELEDVEELRRRGNLRANSREQPSGPQHPSDHLARLAEQSLPFTGSGVVEPRLQTFRQYTSSDVQQVHGGGSIGSFPASIPYWANGGSGSMSGSGLTTPAWGGAGLGPRSLMPGGSHQTASGYFSPWHASMGFTPQGLPNRPTNWWRSSSFAPLSAGFPSGKEGRSPLVKFPTGGSGYHEEGNDGPPSSSLPSLQLHLSVLWSTNTIKVSIATSLLVNHPTPAFLELPFTVSMIGLGVQAGVVVAFQDGNGKEGRKIHISLTEDEDGGDDGISVNSDKVDSALDATPGAVGSGPKRDLAAGGGHKDVAPLATAAPLPQRSLTVGERLLPRITLESSVGQADKHVLRNVGRVEKFLVELIRKAVEDEVSAVVRQRFR